MKLLKEQDPNALVVLSRDEEGNGFSELEDVATEMNFAKDGSDGCIGYRKLTPKLEKMGYTEDDIMEYGKPCIVLWP